MSIEGIVGDIKVRTSTVNGEYSPSDWYVMTPNEDGNTFTHTLSLLSGVTYGYNFNNSDGSGYESGGGLADCAGGNYGNDRTLVVGDVDLNLDVVCWESCSACPSIVEGCTDSTATNYNAEATVDDGTCEYPVLEAANLFISEAAEGSSNNKYIEIFNNTDETVSLGMYAYPTVGNAPSTPGEHEYWNTFADGAEVLPGQVYVVCHGSADPDITAACNEQYTYMSNGDDGLCLVFGSESNFEVLDCVGDFNGDPGSGWEVAGVPDATKDHTLVRKSSVESGNDGAWASSAGTNSDDSEWIVLPQNTWDYLGTHPHEIAIEVSGCMDANATDYNPDATVQAQDQYGNMACTFASCDDVPSEGCMYADAFAGWNDGFGPAECSMYGGTVCEEAVSGCLDPNATNYDPNATDQLLDQYGNLVCVYASCDDVPYDGCMYADAFAGWNEFFGPDDCVNYGGTPCEEQNDGPPECIMDCPNIQPLVDFLDNGADNMTYEEACGILLSWDGDSCIDDCPTEEIEFLTEVGPACTECIAAGDCESIFVDECGDCHDDCYDNGDTDECHNDCDQSEFCDDDDEGIVFSGAFGGAFLDGDNTYVNPTGSEPWAGFANEDTGMYPFSFTDGGEITFTGATSGSAVDVYFRFEYNPYPDTEPSFNTEAVTVSGTDEASYSVAIPPQGENTYSSFLLYVTTPDAPVTLTNVGVASSEYIDPCTDVICGDGQECINGDCVGTTQIDLPVDFESSIINYTTTDFGGNVSSLVIDPENTSNLAVQIIKTNQAATWAGTTIGTPEGFANNIPLSLDNSIMTVRVWSPQAGDGRRRGGGDD